MFEPRQHSKLTSADLPLPMANSSLRGFLPSPESRQPLACSHRGQPLAPIASALSKAHKGAGEPVSRVLSGERYRLRDRPRRGSHSSYAAHCCDRSSDQPGPPRPETGLPRTLRSLARGPYSVLLRVGFAMPLPVTGSAVRSCRTLSPLPEVRRPHRRSALCGTFPELRDSLRPRSPGGRYPPPSFRGARTFLDTPCGVARLPGSPARAPLTRIAREGKLSARDRCRVAAAARTGCRRSRRRSRRR